MKTYIAIPCLDDMPVETVSSLVNLNKVGSVSINFSQGSLVYASRDYLAQCAISEKADYILWIDSDMTFKPDFLSEMLKSIEGKDFVTAVCYRRKPPFSPTIYKKIRIGFDGEAETEAFDELPDENIFEIDACGMAAVLMKTEIAEAIITAERQLFAPISGYGEDISFCIRAKKLGYKLFADQTISVGHISRTVSDGSTWKAWKETVKNGSIG